MRIGGNLSKDGALNAFDELATPQDRQTVGGISFQFGRASALGDRAAYTEDNGSLKSILLNGCSLFHGGLYGEA